MMIIAGIFGAVLMTAFGTYYFQNKKRKRKNALLCKALATSVPGFLLAGSLCGERYLQLADRIDVCLQPAFAFTLLAILFYMAADVLLECRFIWGAVCFSIGHICMASGFLLSGESVLHLGENGPFAVDTGLLGLTLAFCAVFASAACSALHCYFYSLQKKKLFYPMLAYLLILSMMAALAVTAGVRAGFGGSGLGCVPRKRRRRRAGTLLRVCPPGRLLGRFACHPSMATYFFCSGSAWTSFLGICRVSRPCWNLALISASVTASPT